jgi:hypothetical protein
MKFSNKLKIIKHILQGKKLLIVEMPEWTEGRHTYVFSGIELVAYKYLKNPLMVKSGRCHMCGKCCKGFKKEYEDDFIKDGVCKKLKENGECGLGLGRPFSCGLSAKPKNIEGCTEDYEAYDSLL